MAEFPRGRFVEADASDAELDQLSDEFERSDVGVQASLANHIAAISTSGIREYLDELRAVGHFESSEPEDGAGESVAPPDDLGY